MSTELSAAVEQNEAEVGLIFNRNKNGVLPRTHKSELATIKVLLLWSLSVLKSPIFNPGHTTYIYRVSPQKDIHFE